MPTTQENIFRAIKLYNSCFGKFSKFTNMLPWTEPIPDRISHSIELLKQCVLDFKIDKDLQDQIKYSFLIDEYYDDLYRYTLDRTDKSYQSTNLKDLIILCEKDNKQNFINNKELKYDISNKILSKMTQEEKKEYYEIYDINKYNSCLLLEILSKQNDFNKKNN